MTTHKKQKYGWDNWTRHMDKDLDRNQQREYSFEELMEDFDKQWNSLSEEEKESFRQGIKKRKSKDKKRTNTKEVRA